MLLPNNGERAQPYAYYALLLLTLANFINLVDRQILSILGQSIKSDLHLDDAQLGFLLGTAFAVFFAIVGTACGRTADTLSAARIGVGAGEAVGIPCSHSLLSDYFPARNRATVLAIYIGGSFPGAAALYKLTFGCPTFVMAMLGSGLIACISGTVQAWAAPFAMRTFALTPTQIGVSVGLTVAAGAAVGVISGGWLTDKWKRIDCRAPIWVALACLLMGLPAEMLLVFAPTARQYFIVLAAYSLLTAGWAGAYGALIQDLVLPRMRGTAASAFSLVTIVIAAGAGPYWAGKVSALTGSLAHGLMSVQLLLPVASVLLLLTARRLKSETPLGRMSPRGIRR